MLDSKLVRTRFAPSPTGKVHLGSLRTALFAFLFARHHGGVNILRVEDTDQSRKVDGAIENLLTSMDKLGIEFDEGVYIEDGQIKQRGDKGPYIQSERLEIYKKYLDQLIEKNFAYYCFCSTDRLDELRKEQIALKKPPMYDGQCRNLTSKETSKSLEEFKSQNKNPVVRQAINHDGVTVINDLVYGRIEYQNNLLDDQVLFKSDGFPTYHLAVVVDDHLMEVTHVIRGDEWIPSTPKHIQLFEAFGWEATQYAHLPLILNPDKSKLSKRQGDVALEDFLSKGYLPEAMINFMALLGWNPKTEQEIFSLKDLISQFDLTKVNKSGAVFDLVKLDWMNSSYIKQLDNESLKSKLAPFLKEAGFDISEYPNQFVNGLINIEKERLKKLSDISEQVEFYFKQPEYQADLLVWKKSTPEQTKEALNQLLGFFDNLDGTAFKDLESFSELLKTWIADNSFDNGSVLWPLRVALSGLERSPGPFELSCLFYLNGGLESIKSRIAVALDKL